jgi:hypothetical protein
MSWGATNGQTPVCWRFLHSVCAHRFVSRFLGACASQGTSEWFEAVSPKEAQDFLMSKSDGELCSILNTHWQAVAEDPKAKAYYEAEATRRTGLTVPAIQQLCAPVHSTKVAQTVMEEEIAICELSASRDFPPLMEIRYKDVTVQGPCEEWRSVDFGNVIRSTCSNYSQIKIKEPYTVDANENVREESQLLCVKNSPRLLELRSELAAFRFQSRDDAPPRHQ